MNDASRGPISTFALPSEDSDRIERLRVALASSGYVLNRSEIVRLGLLALENLEPDHASNLICKLQRRKPGRPSMGKPK
jgi:hypothetical protein